MSVGFLVLIVASGLFVGANIGANDAANCIGPSVGARLVRISVGLLLVALYAILGALLQGGRVMDTIGKGIVAQPLDPHGVVAALLAAGLFVAAATFRKIPVSTSQAVVGGVAGVGLASGTDVNFGMVGGIAAAWVVSPIVTGLLTYAIYRLTLWILHRSNEGRYTITTLRWMVLLSAGYASYSLGANHLGIAIGPINALAPGTLDLFWLAVAGAFSIGAGAVFFGRGVVETVGGSIIRLDLPGAFAAQMSMAFGLHVFSMLGLPVSSSQAVVGALIGIGLYHGVRGISRAKLVEIVVGWVATPMTAAVAAYGLYLGIVKIF